MVFNKYPITDFNNLNLDWIIEQVKESEADIEAMKDYIYGDNLIEVIEEILSDAYVDASYNSTTETLQLIFTNP